jgi:lipopolysaccharide transport system permease protein
MKGILSPPRPEALGGNQTCELIIRPDRGWFDLHLKEVWQYRDLLLHFVKRDFVSLYKQTILGPLWVLLQPLLTTVVFTFIFGRVAQLPTDGLPPFLFYFSGTLIWAYFADCLNKTSQVFVSNAPLFGKVYFPRLVAPLSILVSNLAAFAIQFGMFLVLLAFFAADHIPVRPNGWVLLTPLLLLLLAGLGLGFGIIVSALTTRYRDLRFVVTFGVQLWMYGTPVIYPVAAVPDRFRPWIQANPLTPVIEAFRYAYLGTGTVTAGQLVYSLTCMLLVLFFGILIFNRVEATFLDTV